MISSEVEVDAQRAMRGMLLLFLVLAVCVHVECRAPTARCRHKVRTPSKCHDQGSCSLYARLTPAENSTLFYCCHSGYKSSNNECVDIDECALDPKPCEETCTNHPGSYACGCHEGFHMNDATGKCVKTTECLNLNCSNSCFYEANGPVCDCPRGFTLQGAKNCTLDKKVCPTNYHIEFESNTCRVMGDDPQMLFAFDGQIYEYSLRQESNLKKLVKVDQNVNAMYYDSGAKVAYFAGQVLTAVNFSSSQPVASRQSLPREAISMAFDYVHKRIYVLDDTSLGLWSMEGGLTSLGTLIDHDGSITQVAVDPGNSWLLYTSKGHVIKARLNGQKFGEVFDFYVHVRNEDVKTEVLAVDDTDNNELFFYYGVNRNIFTFDVAGRHLLWVTEDTPGNIIYMDVFEDFIYYSMQGVDGLTARTKDGLKAPIVYFSGQIVHAHYVNHPARQQESIQWQCSKVSSTESSATGQNQISRPLIETKISVRMILVPEMRSTLFP